MPFILGQSVLGYDFFGESNATYTSTLYQPDAMLWASSYPGDMMPGLFAPSGYIEQAVIEVVIE